VLLTCWIFQIARVLSDAMSSIGCALSNNPLANAANN
jgi:hypothetical protein